MRAIYSEFATFIVTQLTISDKLRNLNHDMRVSDLQSESDLDSIRNSCDVLVQATASSKVHPPTRYCNIVEKKRYKYVLFKSQVRPKIMLDINFDLS